MKKLKDNMKYFVISIVVMLLPMLAGILMWSKLPDQMPVHFDINQVPDSYASKGIVVFGFFAFILVIDILMVLVTSITDEKRKAIPDKVFRLMLFICPAIYIVVMACCVCYALELSTNIAAPILFVLGIVFIVLGNYIPKVRMNPVLGVRIKWTMESKKNWEHTHRYSGWMMCLLGIAFIVMAVVALIGVPNMAVVFIVFLVLVVLAIISMVVYSYLFYKNHKDDTDYYES